MTETADFEINGKKVNVADAFPIDLGFLEDAMSAGVDLGKMGDGLDPSQALILIKMILKRCGLDDADIRKCPMTVLQKLTPLIDTLMKEESADRPT